MPIKTCRSGLNPLLGEVGIQLIHWQSIQSEALKLFSAEIKTDFMTWLSSVYNQPQDYVQYHRPMFFYNRAEVRSEEEDFSSPDICHQEKKLLVNTLILVLLQNQRGFVHQQRHKTIDFIIADGLKKIYGSDEFGFKAIAKSLQDCNLFFSVTLESSNLKVVYKDKSFCLCRFYIKRLQQTELYGVLELGLQACRDVGYSLATGCGAGSMSELFSRKHEQVIAVTLGDGTYNYQQDSLAAGRQLCGCQWLMHLQRQSPEQLMQLNKRFFESYTLDLLRQFEQWIHTSMNITGLLTMRINKEIRGNQTDEIEKRILAQQTPRPVFYLDFLRHMLEQRSDNVQPFYELLDRVLSDLGATSSSTSLAWSKRVTDEELTVIFDIVFYASRLSIIQTEQEKLSKKPLLPVTHPIVLVLQKVFNAAFPALLPLATNSLADEINPVSPPKRSKADSLLNDTVLKVNSMD